MLKGAFQEILETQHVVEGATGVGSHEVIGHKVSTLCRPAGILEEFLEPHQDLDGGLVHQGEDVIVVMLRSKLDLPRDVMVYQLLNVAFSMLWVRHHHIMPYPG